MAVLIGLLHLIILRKKKCEQSVVKEMDILYPLLHTVDVQQFGQFDSCMIMFSIISNEFFLHSKYDQTFFLIANLTIDSILMEV